MFNKSEIRRNGEELNRLRKQMIQACDNRDASPAAFQAYRDALREYHARYQELAFPGGVETARERLRAGDQEAIEYTLDFLEVRPYFFRSGYMYNDFLRVLRNSPLSAAQRQRYEQIRAAHRQYRENRRAD